MALHRLSNDADGGGVQRTRRLPWLGDGVGAVVAGLVAAGASLTLSGAGASAATCATLDPFAQSWSTAYQATWAGQHLAAAVEDEATGCSFHLGATDA